MKISVYTSAFNILKNGFKGWEKSLQHSSELADEVIVCVNTSVDNTADAIRNLELSNLKVVTSNFSYDDPLLDGKVKNIALQACSGDILIQLDIDEYIPKNQYDNWRFYAEKLLETDGVDCLMIPSLNLYGDWERFKDINNKWYMHKRGFHRAPVNYARNVNGTVDTTKSDTCELVDCYGCLVNSAFLPNDLQWLQENNLFVVHFGYVDFESRIERNREFWAEHWKKESGGTRPPHKIHMGLEDFDDFSHQHHLEI